MEYKLEAIFPSLRKLEDALAKPSRWARAFGLAEKLIIPVTVAVIAYVAALGANKIAESQGKASLQQKYVELFWHDITSGEPQRERWASSVLALMDEELATAIENAVRANQDVEVGVRTRLLASRQEQRGVDELLDLVKQLPAGMAWDLLKAPPAEFDEGAKIAIRLRLAGRTIDQAAYILSGVGNDTVAKELLLMVLVFMADRSPENITTWKKALQAKMQ